MQEFALEQVIDGAAGVFLVGGGEAPAAALFGIRLYDAHGEESLEAFELAGQEYAMGEGAEEADVKMVAIGLGREVG